MKLQFRFVLLFVILLIGSILTGFYLAQLTTQGPTIKSSALSSPTPTPDKYSWEAVLFSYPDKNLQVIQSYALDDCVVKNNIFLQDIATKSRKIVLSSGGGCVDYKTPRFIGYTNENLLIFSLFYETPDFVKSTPNVEASTIKEIYSIDPLTNDKKIVMDVNIMPKDVSAAEVVRHNRKFIALFNSVKPVMYSYNMLDKRFYESPTED